MPGVCTVASTFRCIYVFYLLYVQIYIWLYLTLSILWMRLLSPTHQAFLFWTPLWLKSDSTFPLFRRWKVKPSYHKYCVQMKEFFVKQKSAWQVLKLCKCSQLSEVVWQVYDGCVSFHSLRTEHSKLNIFSDRCSWMWQEIKHNCYGCS